MNVMQSVDSLCANEFAFEINGTPISGIFRISGLTTYKLDENGNRVRLPFELAKMVERDGNNIFNKWLRQTMDTRDSADRPTRELSIVAVDDGVEIRRWTVQGAWIQEVRYADFDSASFQMVEEIFTIMYEDIEEGWSATPTLE